MKNTIKPRTYTKLLKFAAERGSPSSIGNVIGSLDEKVIRTYLEHMREENPDVFKAWGSRYKAEPEDDDDDFDLEDEEDSGPIAEQPAPGPSLNVGGKVYPEKFQLRQADGTNTPLEVFSKSEKFGFYLRVAVPVDMRTVRVSTGDHDVDLLALQRDPKGKTELGGKFFPNEKLLVLATIDD